MGKGIGKRVDTYKRAMTKHMIHQIKRIKREIALTNQGKHPSTEGDVLERGEERLRGSSGGTVFVRFVKDDPSVPTLISMKVICYKSRLKFKVRKKVEIAVNKIIFIKLACIRRECEGNIKYT